MALTWTRRGSVMWLSTGRQRVYRICVSTRGGVETFCLDSRPDRPDGLYCPARTYVSLGEAMSAAASDDDARTSSGAPKG